MDDPVTIGTRITITGTFTHALTPADPAAVRAFYQVNGGAPVTLVYGTDSELTKSGTGVYAFDILASEPGEVYYRMDDDLANVAAEGMFVVTGGYFEDELQ